MDLVSVCEEISDDVKKYSVIIKNGGAFPVSVLFLGLLSSSLLVFFLPFKTYIFIVSLVGFLGIWFKRGQVIEESLIVIRDLGVQLETKYASGKRTHRFIDKRTIKSIIINEGIKSYNFIFYMAFIVEGNNKMILAFSSLYPRLKMLIPIYRGTRAIIFGELEE